MTQSDSMHPRDIEFVEATGKTVSSIRAHGGSDRAAVEVRFTDDTFFWFELIPRVALSVRLMERLHGDVELIRDYGSLSIKD